MKNNAKTTGEFSFVLQPSAHGVGVFAAHDIAEGTYLRLFANEKGNEPGYSVRNKRQVPEMFRKYCINRGNTLSGPRDFGRMEIGWHLNHSETPNAVHRDYEYYALVNIRAGEEITIDYNSLGEPEDAKEDYYKKS